MYKLPYFIISILIFTSTTGCQNRRLYTNTQVLMGTFFEVSSPYKEAGEIVFAEIKRIEGFLSKYKPDSEITKLNQSGKLKASRETFYIIKKSKEFWLLTGGAFDITVAPLLDLWGFTDKKNILPDEQKIRKALTLVGSDKIILHDEDNVVEFSFPGMKIDLGAIGKGYALDCAVAKLKENHINSCLINAGGQVYCLGDKFGEPWKVAIRDPRSDNLRGFLELKDQSVSTTGDYEQYFISGGKRYSHIFDPETGNPADSGVVSVTVIAPEGLVADALSTSIFVLGKEKGLALVKKFPGVDVKIVEDKDVQNNQ